MAMASSSRVENERKAAMFVQINEAIGQVARANGLSPYELRCDYIKYSTRRKCELHVLHDDELPPSSQTFTKWAQHADPAANSASRNVLMARENVDSAATRQPRYSCDIEAALNGELPCDDDYEEPAGGGGGRTRRHVAPAQQHGRTHRAHSKPVYNREFLAAPAGQSSNRTGRFTGITEYLPQYDPQPGEVYDLICTWPARCDKIIFIRTDVRRPNFKQQDILSLPQVRRSNLARHLPVMVNTQIRPCEANEPGELSAVCRGLVVDWNDAPPVLVRVFLVDLGRITVEALELCSLRCVPKCYNQPPIYLKGYLHREKYRRALRDAASALVEKQNMALTHDSVRMFESEIVANACPARALCKVRLQGVDRRDGDEPRFPIVSLKVSVSGVDGPYQDFDDRCAVALRMLEPRLPGNDRLEIVSNLPAHAPGADGSTQKSHSDDVLRYSSGTVPTAGGNLGGGDSQNTQPSSEQPAAADQGLECNEFLNEDDLRLQVVDRGERALDVQNWIAQSSPTFRGVEDASAVVADERDLEKGD